MYKKFFGKINKKIQKKDVTLKKSYVLKNLKKKSRKLDKKYIKIFLEKINKKA